MAYGWNATAYQILNPGIEHWLSPDAPAVVGYTRRRNVFLVAGEPVCAPQSLASVISAFEKFARLNGGRVCYVCAAERLREHLSTLPGHSAVAIGAQPVWEARTWPERVRSHPSLRAQINRSRNKGVRVEAVSPEQGRSDPEIEGVLAEWLGARGLPPLHFLAEPAALKGEVADRVLLVARREGALVAFLVASPIAARPGYLIEQIARSSAAPNGTAELLIDSAMRRFADWGRSYVTMGLVALATKAAAEIRANPLWLRAMMRFSRAHANRFYNFHGLERFRTKMLPDRWETIYAISNEKRFSPATLYAMGEAFAGIAPWRAVGIGALKALRQELARLDRCARASFRTSAVRARRNVVPSARTNSF